MRPDSEVEPRLPDHLRDLTRLNQRPKSVRERRLTVLRIGRHLGHPVADASKAELVEWQNWCLERDKPLTQASMHNAIVHVACYLKWLVETEYRPDNPSTALLRPRHSRQGVPHPMLESEIQRALAAAGQPIHAWIGLGAFCGLRCMEIAELAAENIMTEGKPHLRIVGKGGKERVVPMPANLLEELVRDFPTAGYLFERMDGQPGPPSAMRVSERINDHLHTLGITATAHSLRHRFGTKYYAATGDPFLVADAMGHASLDTTRGYVEVVGDKAAAAIEAISHFAA